jgi:2-polyprenyl-3-methyl-5-hydroxy-6-metoxy-1,4-benzoquinol methylase
MYQNKCGLDVTRHFHGAVAIDLYECERSGYRFWRPERVAGDESFYLELSQAWPEYYHPSRWEYELASNHCRPSDRLLEIGCGDCHFLRLIEPRVSEVVGLELNRAAVERKSVASPVLVQTIEEFAPSAAETFDVVSSFQVLEHMVDPGSFLKSALACLKPGGLLLLSTPNLAHVTFAERKDPFDLPPHHMGHFSPGVYQALSEILGAEVLELVEEPREFSLEGVSERTRRSGAYRFVRSIVTSLGKAVYRLNREPGPNLFAALRKR